ncbi:putative DNA polymerase epsilon subunit 3-like [Scophthalmus maximus]|uniref:DNA polymerase epsilon subunit 3 n=1 Tax=Scophthalmus maximus TaxID=52904 RepID=A0A2U9BBE8_SCOMX|nr:putative DNA polymerase epsilon subunit 3-like [Scophthalmus maximus]
MAERPEDLNLPNAVITRIIKEALPDGVNVSKEARRAISQAASVFVLYATSCANNFAMKAKRKTLNAGDVMSAMEEMEFERFLEPLREALEDDIRELSHMKMKNSEHIQKFSFSQTSSERRDDNSSSVIDSVNVPNIFWKCDSNVCSHTSGRFEIF